MGQVALKLPDLKEVELPYVIERVLLMTAGVWNGVQFPASAIKPQAEKLAKDKNATVRLFRGAVLDHQDSTGTLIGETRNHEWDGETLWGDLIIVDESAARIAKYQRETKSKLEGISPRMETQPAWRPATGRVNTITEFKSFGIVLDPAQGDQAMLARDSKGRPILDDGPFVVLEAEPGKGQGVGEPRQQDGGRDFCYCEKCDKLVPHDRGIPCVEQVCPECGAKMVPAPEEKLKEVSLVKKLFCEKCDLLFDEGTEKCSKCGSELKEADEATVKRLQETDKEKEAAEKKKKEEEEAKKKAEEEAAAKKKDAEKYPEPTYKGKPYYRKTGYPYGYKRPYYGKSDGEFHKPSAIPATSFERTLALDQVGDLAELEQDLAGFCGEVLRLRAEKSLKIEEVLADIAALLEEVPRAAELSKVEMEIDSEVAELIKEKEESKAAALNMEIDSVIEGEGKLPPAVREDVVALLSVPTDAVLSKDGEAVDVADHFRKVVAVIEKGNAMELDEKTKTLVPVKNAELSKKKSSEEKREAGKKMAQEAGLASKG